MSRPTREEFTMKAWRITRITQPGFAIGYVPQSPRGFREFSLFHVMADGHGLHARKLKGQT